MKYLWASPRRLFTLACYQFQGQKIDIPCSKTEHKLKCSLSSIAAYWLEARECGYQVILRCLPDTAFLSSTFASNRNYLLLKEKKKKTLIGQICVAHTVRENKISQVQKPYQLQGSQLDQLMESLFGTSMQLPSLVPLPSIPFPGGEGQRQIAYMPTSWPGQGVETERSRSTTRRVKGECTSKKDRTLKYPFRNTKGGSRKYENRIRCLSLFLSDCVL